MTYCPSIIIPISSIWKSCFGLLRIGTLGLCWLSACLLNSDSSPRQDSEEVNESEHIVFYIKGRIFLIDKPEWWDSVEITYPEDLNHEDFTDYVRTNCGADTGTSETWKRACKLWMERELRDDEPFPVFPAHCLAKGNQHLAAAKIFSDLQLLASLTEKKVWYETYLAHNAGKSYFQGGQEALAESWFEKSTQGKDSEESSIKYYANLSDEYLNAVRSGMTPHGLKKFRRK